MLAHVAGIPVEEALLAAPALVAGLTMVAGYVRANAVRLRRTPSEQVGSSTPRCSRPEGRR